MTPLSVFVICFIVLRNVKNSSQATGYAKMINYVVGVQAVNTVYVIVSRVVGHAPTVAEVIALSLPFLYVAKLELEIKKEK
jgi:hypothetical protein